MRSPAKATESLVISLVCFVILSQYLCTGSSDNLVTCMCIHCTVYVYIRYSTIITGSALGTYVRTWARHFVCVSAWYELAGKMAKFEQSLKKFLDHYEELNRTLGPSDDGFYKEFMVRAL